MINHLVCKKKPASLKRSEIKRKSIKQSVTNNHKLKSKFNHLIEHLHLPHILHIHPSHSTPEHLCKSPLTNLTKCNLCNKFVFKNSSIYQTYSYFQVQVLPRH